MSSRNPYTPYIPPLDTRNESPPPIIPSAPRTRSSNYGGAPLPQPVQLLPPLLARPPSTWRMSMPYPSGIPDYQIWGNTNHTSGSKRQEESNDYDDLDDEKERLVIAIDFGATSSGVAYALRSKGSDDQKIKILTDWPGSTEPSPKVPSCMLYAEDAKTVVSWGFDAKASTPSNIPLTELFKLCIDKRSLEGHSETLSIIPHDGDIYLTVKDFLSKIWEYAKDKISSEFGEYIDSRHVWITVPPGWGPDSVQLIRRAAIEAGLVDDHNQNKCLHTISEAVAAFILVYPHSAPPDSLVTLCDVGGVSTSITTFQVEPYTGPIEVKMVSTYSKIMCGSIGLETRFRKYVKTTVKDHPKLLESQSLDHFVKAFAESVQLTFQGKEDDDSIFDFPCLDCDSEDEKINLKDGKISLRGESLRKEVFEPVVNKILSLIRKEMARDLVPKSALIMVGGFSKNHFFSRRVKEMFGSSMRVFLPPEDAECPVIRGALIRGLFPSSRATHWDGVFTAPCSYIMKVRAPAEEADRRNRPQYVKSNGAGIDICERRLKYLIKKGAKIPRGRGLVTRLSKFSKTFSDCLFTVVIYANDTTETFRYTDEADLREICKFDVDLSALPGFRSNGLAGTRNFYTEFDIGLIFNAEDIVCVLLYNGMVCGPRLTIDLRSETSKIRTHPPSRGNSDIIVPRESLSEIQIRLD